MDTALATKTANGKYEYAGLKVQEAHNYNCACNGWHVGPLAPGLFGYDNLAMSLGACAEVGEGVGVEDLAPLIHEAWIENYTYWRDNKPWLKDASYKKPTKALGDERRDKLALLSYDELPEDEKEKDRIIARAYLQSL